MTAENKDNIFHKMDEERVIRDFADVICGDDEKKADVFFASCSRFFEWSGGRLFFKRPGGEKIAATDPSVQEYFKTNYEFLMPTPKVEDHEFNGHAVTIDPAIIESALAGNLTSKSKIAIAFGEVKGTEAPQTELFLRAERTKRNGGERDRDEGGRYLPKDDESGAGNPFSRAGWSLTEQMRVFKNDPDRAARLAKKAGVSIGDAHPARA